jgi:dihydrolipoamide dehydrogenase
MEYSYDLIIVGSGPAGYVGAIKAAQLGLQVAIVEKGVLGGTCLNQGCIPTKSMIHSAHLYHEIKLAARFGIHVDKVDFNFDEIHDRKNQVVLQLRTGIEQLMKANKITVLNGTGKIAAPHQVEVDGQPHTCQNILVATGARPARPPIPGMNLADVVTSDELLLENGRWFNRLLIIGGGVIGVEFAGVYQALGAEVVIVEALDRIIATQDREISQNLSMILKKQGVSIHTSARVESMEQGEKGILVHIKKGEVIETIETDGVLVAVGRSPNTKELFAEGMDLNLQRGYIPVNERYETQIPSIYAIGDVTAGSIQLAHNASSQGINAASIIAGQKPPVRGDVVPSCIYTNPEIATVGLTADEAKAQGLNVKVGKFPMSANGKTLISMGERGFIKIVADSETEKVIGAQLMCERATDLLDSLTLSLIQGLTVSEMLQVIRPHPTYTEAIGEAAEDWFGHAIHIAPKRR